MPKKPLRIETVGRFDKQLDQASLEANLAFKETLGFFLENPDHPVLRNHPLGGKYQGYRSIDVTGDWRAIFRIKETKKEIIITFHLLDTHSQLYG